MHKQTLTELAQGLAQKQFSSVELTKHYLERINRHNPTLNAFNTVTEELALQQAQQADKLIAQGNAGLLTGIPIAHKDLFCTKGVTTTCSSKMLANFVPPYESTVTEKLKQAGMVLLGKTNMDEFAMGSSNEHSYFGPCKNPWNTSRTPGGSSGGSASAVAASLTPAATGTDTGGSVRQPAAMTGITGLKPTYGRISRFGMIAYASSLDQAGTLTRNAADAALLLQTMAGFDEKDSTSANQPVPDYQASLAKPLQGLRLGLPEEYFNSLDETINKPTNLAIKQFEQLGAQIKSINLPNNKLAVPAYYVIAPAECSSNLARFDGVRYGYRCEAPKDLHDLYARSRGEGFGTEVKRRILIGTYTLSAGYYDAYYLKAQKIRRLIKQDFVAAFDEVDLVLSPATPSTAFKLGEIKDPLTMYQTDSFTTAVNLAGLPAISIPVGFSQNLPVGLQLIGNYFNEAGLLNAAYQYQQQTDWHLQSPTEFEKE